MQGHRFGKVLALLWALVWLWMPACGAADAHRPALTLTRWASLQMVAPGGETVLSYRVENSGNVPLTDVEVTDDICGQIARIEQMAPGEYRTLQKHVSILRACQSTPEASYQYNGMQYAKALEPLSLTPAVSGLSVESCTWRLEDPPVVSITLRNTGNTRISGLSISEETLFSGRPLAGELLPGQLRTDEIALPSCEGRTVRFTIQGVSEAEEVLAAHAPALSLPKKEADSQGTLSISARETEDGQVELTLQNDTGADIASVALWEATAGLVRTLACAAEGETVVLLDAPAPAPCRARFFARYAVEGQQEITVLCRELLLTRGSPAAPPPRPVVLGTEAYAVLMYAGLSVLLGFVLLWLGHVWLRRRRKRTARRKRVQRMRSMRRKARLQEEDWVQTRPHKPVNAGRT